MPETPVIIGAGPAGAAAALFLAKAGIPAILTDRAATFPRDKTCGDALSGKVVEVLHKLDPALRTELDELPAALGSWGVRFVAPNGRDVRVPFQTNYDPTRDRPPGYLSKRLHFDHFLQAKAAAHPLVDYRAGWHLQSARAADGRVALDFSNGQRLHTPLVLGADGAHSVVAKQLHGFTVEPKHYCAGIRVYYDGIAGLDADGFIELHFLRKLLPGYLWIFPLPGGQANVGLGIRSDVVARKRLNLKALLPEIIAAVPELRERFANARPLEAAKGFGLPLGSKRRPVSGPGYLLLGDAASLIDPFTGEGIGNALFSARFAAEQVARCQATGDYSAAALRAYDQALYHRLWDELRLGRAMQRLVEVPWLFNFVVNKAQRSPTLRDTISVMFEDIELRDRLRSPGFYLKLLFE